MFDHSKNAFALNLSYLKMSYKGIDLFLTLKNYPPVKGLLLSFIIFKQKPIPNRPTSFCLVLLGNQDENICYALSRA